MKLNNLTIAPKLGILVGMTLIGLCIAGALAGYLMQQEMLRARIDQTKSIVEMARNMATELKKDVDAGKLTKEQAMAELRKLGNAMTYDKGAGYLFGTTYDGITQTIAQMSEITSGIATSIEQQGEATREIARNIQSVAAGSSEINAHIGGVTSAAEATGKAAGDVLSNARELDNQSGMLRNAVDEFLAKVRAA